MFMFRGKKKALIKRLLEKSSKRTGDETRRALEELLNNLQENQLKMLLTAVGCRAQESSKCVLLLRETEPHVLCCQAFNWPDLKHGKELRQLPICRSGGDPVYVCCNPWHWSRLCQPESPPPPYSRFAVDMLRPEDRAPSEAAKLHRGDSYLGSVTTSGEGSNLNQRHWCQLAYWELSHRVGPIFPVEPTTINVFGDVVRGDGLSLHTLSSQNCSPPESVSRARSKIGLGVTIALEDGCVWVYNRSEHSVFINSFTLENADSHSPTRVPAEHCLCVYDLAARENYGWSFTSRCDGPIDRDSIRLSFVKGWGQHYSRQDITSCPCWLEILLVPCR